MLSNHNTSLWLENGKNSTRMNTFETLNNSCSIGLNCTHCIHFLTLSSRTSAKARGQDRQHARTASRGRQWKTIRRRPKVSRATRRHNHTRQRTHLYPCKSWGRRVRIDSQAHDQVHSQALMIKLLVKMIQNNITRQDRETYFTKARIKSRSATMSTNSGDSLLAILFKLQDQK